MKILLEKVITKHEYVLLKNTQDDFDIFFDIVPKQMDEQNKYAVGMRMIFVQKNGSNQQNNGNQQQNPEITPDIDYLLEGQFTIIKNDNDDIDFEKVMRVNCCSILFPFLRERIARIFSDAGYFKPFYLPSKNFVEAYRLWKERTNQ